ncbi:MAG: hypothetical protein HDS84_06910 [Bacteroidales bacterium]|nr:hypothetical protein [Bacteroidales bacterium]
MPCLDGCIGTLSGSLLGKCRDMACHVWLIHRHIIYPITWWFIQTWHAMSLHGTIQFVVF